MKKITYFISGLLILLTACKPDVEVSVALPELRILKMTTDSAEFSIIPQATGSDSILSGGLCWSTNENPAITDANLEQSSARATFKLIITGLTPNTNYHVRAFTKTKTAVFYSKDFSFTTSLPIGTQIADVDGNVYSTVTIGRQMWLVENLKVMHYRNGDSIPEVLSDSAWSVQTTGARCNYNFSADPAFIETYGRLYNWYAVADKRNIAPQGWRVATESDFTELREFLKYANQTTDSVAKMIASTTDWSTSTVVNSIGNNLLKNNTTGFKALPGGYRYPTSAKFKNTTNSNAKFGCWWTTSESGNLAAKSLVLSSDNGLMLLVANDKRIGASVRCVRDVQ